MDRLDLEAVHGLRLPGAERLVRVVAQFQKRRSCGRIERLEDRPGALPEVDRDVRVDEPQLLDVVVMDVGNENGRKGGRFPGHVGRVSTVSAGVTRSDGIRPVFVSTRKSARMPRICPSSVMTVFPRSSVAKTFIPAAARILRSLFFLSGLRGDDIEAKPSELEPNE